MVRPPFRAWLRRAEIAEQSPQHAKSFRTLPGNQVAEARVSTGGDPVKAQTIRLPADLWRSLKLRAVDEERPMSEIVRDAIQGYLSMPKNSE